MGIRYTKRLGRSQGWGLNISGSGISSSYRSKLGAIGSNGFSIKSGIPGLSYRGTWGARKARGNGTLLFLLAMLAYYVMYGAILLLYNFFRFFGWMAMKIVITTQSVYLKWMGKKELH